MGKTSTEKILTRTCGREVTPGEIVYPDPDLVVLTDLQLYHGSTSITDDLRALGVASMPQPGKYMVTLSHAVPVTSNKGAEIVKGIRRAVAELGIENFFDEGCHGIEHSIPIEKGLARPGMLVFGGDTHASTMGAVGALGIPLPYEFLTVLATGTAWIRVPQTIRIELVSSFPEGVLSKDLILWIISDIGAERANYRVLEFFGPGVKTIGVEGRMTLCNVPVQIGAKSAIVEPDEKTVVYVKSRTAQPFEVVKSDPDADFEQAFQYDLSHLEPMVAMPPNPDNVRPVTALAGTKIHQVSLGACPNGMLEDLRIAAQVLKGHRIRSGVRFIVCPATQQVFLEAVREGLIEIFLSAGATITEPGCSICLGTIAPLAAGESCISTITRNEPGRLGSAEADIYLASPATLAASAIKGEITDPREFLQGRR
ncbi:aconitase/3-isopropylmalate dehydratase large subunit family protein [Chloroflexota bacterium]